MQHSEKFNKYLETGETICWSGVPQPYSIFDVAHKTATVISLCWALVWGIVLVGGYYEISVSQEQEIKKGIMAFCAVIPLALAWVPVSDKNNVKKLLYAITDKKAIVITAESDRACIMNIADIDEVRAEKTADGNCHVRVGSPTFKASVRKLTGLAFRGEFDNNDANEKVCKGLVFYNVTAEDGKTICGLLKKEAAQHIAA